jgi:signal transduction histidine kinase
MKQELDASLDALENLLYESQASEAATRQFLDDAAHQLRAPITSLRASAETLLRGPEADERDRLLGAVVRETSRASRLMSGLLQMARLNQGRKFNPSPCDLVALCQDELDRVHFAAPQLELKITETGGEGSIGKPDLDSEAVAEILGNLLDNARRHARTGIEIVLARADGTVELAVANDGPRIPSDKTDAIFDRFISLDGLGGSGLGLPIARQLAEAQSGSLAYEDGRFVLRLPVG